MSRFWSIRREGFRLRESIEFCYIDCQWRQEYSMAELDLLLVNPGGRELIYQDLGAELSSIEPPLWCRLIAGYVLDRGYAVEIFDNEAEGNGPAAVARQQGTESRAEDHHGRRARGGSPGTHDERRGDRFRLQQRGAGHGASVAAGHGRRRQRSQRRAGVGMARGGQGSPESRSGAHCGSR